MRRPQPARVCETCGHPLPDFNALKGLTGKQQKLFDIVDGAGTRGIALDAVFDAVYGDDPNGGPEHKNVLYVLRTNMRDKLLAHGLKIVTRNRLWYLEKIG